MGEEMEWEKTRKEEKEESAAMVSDNEDSDEKDGAPNSNVWEMARVKTKRERGKSARRGSKRAL